MNVFSKTDVGQKRKVNQDYVYECAEKIGNLPNLFIVADGMGGHAAGDFASKFTVETIESHVKEATDLDQVEEIIGGAIEKANAFLRVKANEDDKLYGMGTTVVVASVEDYELKVANVGDSRLYIVSEDEIRQITIDHSLVEEMVQSGGLDRIAARNHPDKNIITRAVGAADFVDIDFFTEEVKEGDILLMCSDGLSNMIEDDELCRIICDEGSLFERGNRLIDRANENGGLDNISVLLIDIFSDLRNER